MEKRPRRSAAGVSPEEAFGRVLQEIRKKRGVSQEQLGFESGYHRTYISLLERGLKSPSLGTMMSLSAALDVPASKIIRRVEGLVGMKSWKSPKSS